MKIYLLTICSFMMLQNIDLNIKLVKNYLNKDYLKEILFVNIDEQKLYYIKKNKIIKEYYISSSINGKGNKSGSNKTPLGLHSIKFKIGDNTPIYGKMIGRVFTGEIAKIYKDKTKSETDDITSRIMWLEGLEKEKNKGTNIDSFKRYIYIHGTSEEGYIGTPASHGCIRMKNKDVIDLYNKIEVGILVLIL